MQIIHRRRLTGIQLTTLWALIVLTLGTVPTSSSAATGQLRLIFNSNVQGKLHDCGCKSNPLGGIARRAALIDRISADAPATLLLDGGNLLPFPNSKQSESARLHLQLTHRMGYRTVGVGSTEVAMGIGRDRPLFEESNLEFVSANLQSDAVRRMVVERRGDLKIAFTSVVSEDLARRADAEARVLDPTVALRELLPEMHARADLVVVACALESGRTAEIMSSFDPELAPDLAIESEGSAHPRRLRHAGATVLTAANSGGKYLGQIDATRASDGSWHFEPTMVPLSLDLPEDSAVAAAVKKFEAGSVRGELARSER